MPPSQFRSQLLSLEHKQSKQRQYLQQLRYPTKSIDTKWLVKLRIDSSNTAFDLNMTNSTPTLSLNYSQSCLVMSYELVIPLNSFVALPSRNAFSITNYFICHGPSSTNRGLYVFVCLITLPQS
jgi:hypothetical protein